MSRNTNSEKKNILGFVAAMRTLLDNYPELQKNENLVSALNTTSPLGFLLGLAEILGLTKEDLLNWISKILSGNNASNSNPSDSNSDSNVISNIHEGVLDAIEYAVKIILLINIKNLFTCSINPLIPFDVLKYPNGIVPKNGGKGIKIPITTIDTFNVLQNAPNNEYGKMLYFDNEMPSNSFWQSSDFNCFMWYVINKSSTIDNEKLKLVWDNRVKYSKKFKTNEYFKNNFFDECKGNGVLVNTKENKNKYSYYTANEKNKNSEDYKNKKKSGNYIEKAAYVILEYNEIDNASTVSDALTFFLNADRYLYKIGEYNGETIYLPKTIFEFNYDYIFSLKLFDSKVLVANIINSILGIANSSIDSLLNVKFTLQQEAIAGKVSQIVKKLMETENTVIDDSFFSFSNSDYDALLNDTEIKYSENYKFGEVYGTLNQNDINNITKELNGIGNAATLNEQETIIKNIFTNVSATAATNGEVSLTGKFTLGENIILELIKSSVTQIVLQVLSPKVMLLYAINSYFMGDITDGDFSKINTNNLFKGLNNLIISITRRVLEILLKELLSKLINELKNLLNDLIRKLLIERIEYYTEILRGILSLIKTFYDTLSNKNNKSIIDNVNFADIVPPNNKPN